jgi:hypothetical protein
VSLARIGSSVDEDTASLETSPEQAPDLTLPPDAAPVPATP